VQISSVDKRTTIDIIEAEPKNPQSAYVFRVEVGRSGGKFCGENEQVHFLKVSEFKAAFETFLRVREGSVVLNATEDCRLEFFRWNAKGDVGVRYTVGKLVYEGDPLEVSTIAVSGKFKLHGEFVNQMAAQLLELLNA